jgi:hypothetical protein
MTRRHQGAKMKILVLKVEPVKTEPSGLEYRIIQFYLKRYNLIRVSDLVSLENIWTCTSQRATSCCLYKHRQRWIVIEYQSNQSKYYFLLFFTLFALVLGILLIFTSLDLLATATTP